MAYAIGPKCLACHNCALECPTGAIDYVGTKYEVDPDKCISCGHCAEVCNVGMAYDADNPPVPPAPHERRELTADLVVLGGGGSGLIAAVRASELSGKKVIVLEKAQKCGGSAWFAGFGGFGSQHERDAGIPDNREKMVEGFRKRLPTLDPELIRNAVYASGEMVDWFVTHEDVADYFSIIRMGPHQTYGLPHDKKLFYNLKNHDDAIGPGRGGSFLVRYMLQIGKKLGVEFLTGHEAMAIETDDSGAVCGVLAKDGGGEVHIACRAVVCATGGFLHNDELLKKYWPWFFTEDQTAEPAHRFGAPTNTGDVVRLGKSAGALIDDDGFWINFFGPVHHPFDYSVFKLDNEPEIMACNANGERYFNEGHFSNGANILPLQPGRISYSILDSETVALIRERMSHGPDARAAEDLPQALETEVRLDTPLKRADTLEELARQCGFPVETFLKTVKRYNELCDKGVDEDFGKQPEALRPIRTAPFYAIFGKMASDGAFGGIKIDPLTRAYRKDGKGVVPGLYATGDNSSGWAVRVDGDGDARQYVLSEMSWACSSGFIAGTQAAAYLA